MVDIVINGVTRTATQAEINASVLPDTPIEQLRENAELNRFDFATAAAQAGFVSWAEATQWAAGNAVPASVQAVIDALPAAEQGPALMSVLARPTIRRTSDLMVAVGTAFSTDAAGLDSLFGLN